MLQVIENLKNKLYLLEEKFNTSLKSKSSHARIEDDMQAIKSLRNEIAVLENQKIQ